MADACRTLLLPVVVAVAAYDVVPGSCRLRSVRSRRGVDDSAVFSGSYESWGVNYSANPTLK